MSEQEDLTNYIHKQIQSGIHADEITSQLRGAGWDEKTIASAFSEVQARIVPAPVSSDTTATFEANGKKRGKTKTSWLLLKQSLRVLRGNKQLIKYPLMGGIISLFVTIVFGLIFWAGKDVLLTTKVNAFGGEDTYLQGWGYILGFFYYILTFFIVFTYNAGLAAHVLDIFRGKSGSYKHYMKLAWAKKGPILMFSLISTTVGLILHAIEQRGRLLGWIVSRIFGTLWAFANLFTIPIIVETDSSAPSAIKQSTKLFISRWGENIAARITFGGIAFLFYLLVAIPAFIALGFVLSLLGVGGIILFILVMVLSIVAFAVIETAASNILSTALYYYAQYQQIPAAFDANLLNSVFVPKKKKRFGKKS